MKALGKLRTFLDYTVRSLELGVDIKSKMLLTFMLPLVKFGLGKFTPRQIYNVQVKIGPLKQRLCIRPIDIFIIREVLVASPYVHPSMKKSPPRCIVDLGAHIGLASLSFKAVFPDAEIHCYEPDPENFKLLQRNMMSLPGVVLHQEAVGLRRTKSILYIPDNRHSASSLLRPLSAKQIHEVVCQVKPLDDILSEVGRQVDLIKFDIEGIEYEVFASSRLVHAVKWIVGELKGDQSEVERFVTLFPHHEAYVCIKVPKMAYVYLKHKGS